MGLFLLVLRSGSDIEEAVHQKALVINVPGDKLDGIAQDVTDEVVLAHYTVFQKDALSLKIDPLLQKPQGV